MIHDLPKSLIEAATKILQKESTNHPMIDVDGQLKHMHNEHGKPIHPTDEGIRNFHRWFGDSQAVDEHGRPKVFYHSTLKDLPEFEPKGKFMGHTGTSGISVTDNPEMASRYLDRYGNFDYKGQPFTKNVIPVYIKTTNPLRQNEPIPTNIPRGQPLPDNYVSPVVKMGHDALIRDTDAISRKGNVKHSTAKNAIRGKEIVLFNPNQIKSAIGNDGTWDHPSKIAESYHGSHKAPSPTNGHPIP